MAFAKGHAPWNKGKTGLKAWNKDKHLTEEHKKNLSTAHMGKVTWNKGKRGLYKHSEEWKQRMSSANSGENNPFFNKHHSEDACQRMSKARTGKKRGSYSEEHKKKMSIAKIGKTFSEEHIKNLSISHIGHTPSNKGKPRPELSGEKHPCWKGGVSFEPYCPKFNKALKRRIRERDNHTCGLCGVKENGQKLSVHHIHYDKPNCDPDLISLCRSCNAIVNFNRDYYEELFMKKLRERCLVSQKEVL